MVETSWSDGGGETQTLSAPLDRGWSDTWRPHHCTDDRLLSALQEILEEVRKELQKVKEEIIGGGTRCLLCASLARRRPC